jgi:ankyrin repeat protein
LELRDAVRATIESLPKSQQAPVTLYYLGNYSQSEIAEMLDLSLSAVKKRLERARYQLEERMRGMAQEYLHTTRQARGITPDLFTTLMEAAALEGQAVLLEMLFLEGMDVNEQDANGQTMLHWAAKAGHLGAVELLLDYHPDAARRDHAGQTALQFAVSSGHLQVAERLRQYMQQK